MRPPGRVRAGWYPRAPVEQKLPDFQAYRGKKPPRFANDVELECAKLLDYYRVPWEYEPRTFVLEWDGEGNAAQAFTPDFYLPAYDLFIEITTLNQKLVTKKNAKVRRLREQYPDVNVKIFYQRDYLNLLVKYGLEEPSQLADAALDDQEPRPLDFAVGD